MRIYICDRCKKEFPQPLDEEKYKQGNEWFTLDLCAACRKELKAQKEKPIKEFFEPLLKLKKK
jgi:hypothetical protein